MKSIVVQVKELPQHLQNALTSVGYNKRDITIKASEQTSLQCSGGNGYRAFVCVVNLSTGEHKTTKGSWGGANVFNPGNAVDLNDALFTIPSDAAVIKGQEGGGHPVLASITVAPSTLTPMLPAMGDNELTPIEAKILRGMRMIGAYRKEIISNVPIASIDACVAKGWITRNRAGALSLTTLGKNIAPKPY